MSQRNVLELIKEAPVEWKRVGDITNYEQPTEYIVRSSDYNDSFPTPVLTAGQSFILGYTNEANGIYYGSTSPVIIFDDFTTANKWVNFDFKVKSSAMKIITSADESVALLRYIYHWLNTIPSGLVEGDHKRQWISNYANKIIPIPPLAIQQEIVRILDTMTALISELISERSARQKQYNYYRDQLLSFDEDVEWRTLGDVVELTRGTRLVRNQLSESGECAVFQNSLTPLGYYHEHNAPADTTYIICAGAAGEVGYSRVNFWAADDVHYLVPRENLVISRYIFHTLIAKQHQLFSQVRRASIPRLSRQSIERIEVPIPSLEKQSRIVGILDKFDTLTNSISEGLPREILLRQKQYAYYRDLLLGFPQPESEAVA